MIQKWLWRHFRICSMQNYQILKELGSGSYGTVYSAMEKRTHKVVAIKKIHERASWDQAKNMVELKSFKKIREHPNVVTLYEMFGEKDGTIYFVFELVDGGSLYDYLLRCQKALKAPPECEVCRITFQILRGIRHIHDSGIIHRDLKLENVLLQRATPGGPPGIILSHQNGPVIPKLADLGCAKDTRARFTQNTLYTGTRWYRSFELLLRDPRYGKPNDIWALGCMIAEMLTLRPLFQGQSELDMLHLILQTLGPLSDGEFPDYGALAGRMSFVSAVPVSQKRWTPGDSHRRIAEKLASILRGISSDCIDCIAHMLELNPAHRWDADQLLAHPWFRIERETFGNDVFNTTGGTTFSTTQNLPSNAGSSLSRQPSTVSATATGTGEPDAIAKAKLILAGARPQGQSVQLLDNTNSIDDIPGLNPRSKSTAPPKTTRKTKDLLNDNNDLENNLKILDEFDF